MCVCMLTCIDVISCMLSDAGQDDPSVCYQCHDPVCYNKLCGSSCTPLASAAAGEPAEGFRCNPDNACVDATKDAFTCPARTTTTMNPEWAAKSVSCVIMRPCDHAIIGSLKQQQKAARLPSLRVIL